MGEMAFNVATLANLAPFTGKGDPRNGTGPPANHGQSVVQQMNLLGGQNLSEDELRAIGEDSKCPVFKRQAAKSLLRSLSDDWAKNGKPHAADDLDRVLDRTEGRAVQRVAVETREVKDPAALKIELLRLLADQPQLRASLGLDVAGILGAGDAGNEGTPPKST